MKKKDIKKAIDTSCKKYVECIIDTRMYFTDYKEEAVCLKKTLEQFIDKMEFEDLTLY